MGKMNRVPLLEIEHIIIIINTVLQLDFPLFGFLKTKTEPVPQKVYF